MAEETTCTLVETETGNRYAHLPESGRVFYNYADLDGESKGWKESPVSWLAMSRHMYYVTEEKQNQPIPDDLQRII